MRGTVLGERFVIEDMVSADAFTGRDGTSGTRVLVQLVRGTASSDGVSAPFFSRHVAPDGRVFHVQELIDGKTLEEELRAGPISPERVARIGEVLSAALERAHAAGVVHGGITSARVVLTTASPGLRLVDFGIDASHESSEANDVACIGALLRSSLMPSLTPAELSRCIDACLAANPVARPSARVLAAQLREIADGLGADALAAPAETGALSRLMRDVAHVPTLRESRASSWNHERFDVRRKLGQGGFGVVYEAFDKTRQSVVAVKALARVDGEKLYRFKREFRALTDIVHPNLVRLHELFAAEDTWFFSMELVHGTDFLSFVRTSPSSLRACLRQLVDGIAALHATGRLHRDLKPHNVLVTEDGVVKILDFGLVAELSPDDKQTAESAGTPAYIAPETIAHDAPTTATDWYSFGAMLYEALTGSVPFEAAPGGRARNVLVEKLISEPPTSRSIAPSAPADLDALASALLRRDPSARPSVDAIRAVTHVDAKAPVALASPRTADLAFVGREAELATLQRALEDSRAAPVVIVVEGESGIGKSALVRRFLRDVRDADRACVLSGRCYEREAVPYKGFDGVIDALSRHLRTLPAGEVAASVFPRRRDAMMLARLFPVLERVPAWPSAVGDAEPVIHPQELLSSAFNALRELFARLGERGPVVVFIDDLQWADGDSFALLDALMQQPHPPPLLLACTARPGRIALKGDVRRILLAGLSPNEVGAMVAEAGRGRVDDTALVAETRGHPQFLQELLLQSAGEHALKLDDVLWTRISQLSAHQRALLELASLAGAPLSMPLLAAAADAPQARAIDDVRVLCASRLLRTADAGDAVEPYHDRVRELVVARTDESARRRGHVMLADTLERADVGGYALSEIVRHLQAAGDIARASALAPRAARHAEAALAFDRAVELYGLALENTGLSASERAALMLAMADALSYAGRGLASADKYLQAATAAGDPMVRTRLEARAAVVLVGSGHVVRGVAILRRIMVALGEPWPTTNWGAMLLFAWTRLRLRLRGASYRARDPALLSARDRLRLEIGMSISPLGHVDPLRAWSLQTRGLLLALDLGAETPIAMLLSNEVFLSSLAGERKLEQALAIAAKADEIVARVAPALRAVNASRIYGAAQLFGGRFAQGAASFKTALQLGLDPTLFLTGALAGARLGAGARYFRLLALEQAGGFRELRDEFDPLLLDARRRGDLFFEHRLLALAGIRWLVDDRPAESLHQIAAWPRATGVGSDIVDGFAMSSALTVALYNHDVPPATDGAWADLARYQRAALVANTQFYRVYVQWLHTRLLLACGRPQLRDAARAAARLRKEKGSHAAWKMLLVDAGIAALEGRDHDAIAKLRAAATAADANQCPFFGAVARRQLGRLIGGDEGRALVEAADVLMSCEVKSPARFANMFAPGFSQTPSHAST